MRLVPKWPGDLFRFGAMRIGGGVVILHDAGETGGQVEHSIDLVCEGVIANVRLQFVSAAGR